MTTTRESNRATRDGARSESGTRATRRTALRATIAAIAAKYPLSRNFTADIATSDMVNQLLKWGHGGWTENPMVLLANLFPDLLEDALVDAFEEVDDKGHA